MKDEPRSPTKHQLDHAIPTVIHDPEEDLPLLARWLHRAMQNPTRFWGLVGGLVVVVVGLTVLGTGFSLGKATSDEAWVELEAAKTPAERVEIAQKHPKTPAGQWALLQAADAYYTQGFADLPANRDAALPNLKKALDLFEQVAREAPEGSDPARAAAFGAARTLEARNELDRAIKQYDLVAKTWPGTQEAEQAKRLAAELRKPESVAFYKDLYAYKPVEATIPPAGQGGLTLPPGHPPIGGGSMIPSPFMIPPPPPGGGSSMVPPPPPEPTTPPKPAPESTLPDDPFAPATKAEPLKIEPPAEPPAPKAEGEAPKP